MSAIITISDDLRKKLADKAREASYKSNPPQSQRPVGAAVMARNGTIFQGAWYEQSQGAPHYQALSAALGNFLASGGEKVIAVAVYSPDGVEGPGEECHRVVQDFGSNIEFVSVSDKYTGAAGSLNASGSGEIAA